MVLTASSSQGPNPWKVAIILNELNIPYETELMDFSVLHQGMCCQPSSSPEQTGKDPDPDLTQQQQQQQNPSSPSTPTAASPPSPTPTTPTSPSGNPAPSSSTCSRPTTRPTPSPTPLPPTSSSPNAGCTSRPQARARTLARGLGSRFTQRRSRSLCSTGTGLRFGG